MPSVSDWQHGEAGRAAAVQLQEGVAGRHARACPWRHRPCPGETGRDPHTLASVALKVLPLRHRQSLPPSPGSTPFAAVPGHARESRHLPRLFSPSSRASPLRRPVCTASDTRCQSSRSGHSLRAQRERARSCQPGHPPCQSARMASGLAHTGGQRGGRDSSIDNCPVQVLRPARARKECPERGRGQRLGNRSTVANFRHQVQPQTLLRVSCSTTFRRS